MTICKIQVQFEEGDYVSVWLEVITPPRSNQSAGGAAGLGIGLLKVSQKCQISAAA